jgi:hypothetical protein
MSMRSRTDHLTRSFRSSGESMAEEKPSCTTEALQANTPPSVTACSEGALMWEQPAFHGYGHR